MTERMVFKKEIPRAEMQICLFHVLRTFRRELATDKMGINGGQKANVLEIIQEIIFSQTEESYYSSYQQLQDTGLTSVCRYFRDHWEPIRKEWVECFKQQEVNLSIRTNNKLENFFQKLKSVTASEMCLKEFLATFF